MRKFIVGKEVLLYKGEGRNKVITALHY